jgi:hypothetical protein
MGSQKSCVIVYISLMNCTVAICVGCDGSAATTAQPPTTTKTTAK